MTRTDPTPRELHPAGKGRGDLVIEAPGLDEVNVVPWPLLLRHKLVRKVEASDRYPWLVLSTALFGLFTVGFTVTLLAVSIPTIAGDLDASQATLAWVITGPLLAYGIVGPTLGKAGDLFGYKKLYLIGIAGAGIFAGFTALAWSAPTLILFRVLGAGIGAATGPASMAMLNRVFEPEQRVKALGYWSFANAGGPVLGVVVGAPIVEAFGWRWIFAAQVPLCLAGFLVALALLPETERQKGVRFDLAGAGLLALSVTSLLFGLNRGAAWGWSNTVVVVSLLMCPFAMAAFIAYERRARDPLLKLDYFRDRNFAGPIAVQFFTNFAYMGGFILTPLLLADGLGYGTTKTGLLSIFRPLAFALTGPAAGYLAARVGIRGMGIGGSLLISASMVVLSGVDLDTGYAYIIFAMVLSGMGLGASSPSMAATIANTVDEADFGVAGATQQLAAQVGVVAGIQIMQTVQASREEAVGLIASYSDAYLVGAGVAALGAVCALVIRRGALTPASG
jgi:EmrB/QacA subfamily drug resistance transporter